MNNHAVSAWIKLIVFFGIFIVIGFIASDINMLSSSY